MFRLLAMLILLAPGPAFSQQSDLLPANLLQVPASVAMIFVAETSTSTLHRFEISKAGPENRDERYMSIGQNGVGKQRPWDRRTPLGIYFVTEQLDTSALHERYGPTAFPLDYPNIWDRINKRSGDGIWIHGVTPNGGRRPPLDTDGCIALPNEELLAIETQLVPLVTPVVITREIQWVTPEQLAATAAELIAAVDAWAASYRSGDLHKYLSLYADDFGYRGMDRKQWASFRAQTMAAVPLRDFTLTEVLLLADPEDDRLYLSRFRQTIIDAESEVATIKRLYWRRSENGELKIVAEDNG
jgi:murein L,D-transpeptidase YafK